MRGFFLLSVLSLVACEPAEVRFPPDIWGEDVQPVAPAQLQWVDSLCFDDADGHLVTVATTGNTGSATFYITNGEDLEVHSLPLVQSFEGYDEFATSLPITTPDLQIDGVDSRFGCAETLTTGTILRDRFDAITACDLRGANTFALEVVLQEQLPELEFNTCVHGSI